VVVEFMDLEKAYGRVEMMAIWEELKMYAVGCKILGAIKSIYKESMVCV
jgi:hypothetical protein